MRIRSQSAGPRQVATGRWFAPLRKCQNREFETSAYVFARRGDSDTYPERHSSEQNHAVLGRLVLKDCESSEEFALP